MGPVPCELIKPCSLPQQIVAMVEEMKRGAMERAMRAMRECIFVVMSGLVEI